MDGDTEFPTICGTGTEDYFCGSYNFENQDDAAVPGVHHAVRGPAARDAARRPYQSQQRFSLYRWHIIDPIRFEQDLRVTIQALGWRSDGTLPAAAGRHRVGRVLVPGASRTPPFRRCPPKDVLEIV